MQWLQSNRSFLLRLAIAFAFLYPAIDAFITPGTWISWFPPFMLGIVPNGVLLGIWSVVEIIIAVWILSGKRIFIPSLLAALMLCAVVVFNIPLMEIVFRDIALALVAAYLALEAWDARSTSIG